jgi:thiamine pyrophosphate-dependent acetolactate synthase large subunit-like protein
VAVALLAERRRRCFASDGRRTPTLEEELRLQTDGFDDQGDDRGMDLRTAMVTLDGMLPEERTLVVDGGAFHAELIMGLRVPDPSAFVFSLHFGSIGLALGCGIGASIARPDRTAVVLVGDGGLMMSLAELDTAVQHNLPMIVVVMNDAAYGAETFALRAHKRSLGLAYFQRPDFAQVMNSLGGEGYSVRSDEELRALAPALKDPTGPILVNVNLRRGVVTDWYQRLMPGLMVSGDHR